MGRLVFLPVSRSRAADLRAGTATGPWAGVTATAALATALGASQEEAEYAALNQAGVAALGRPDSDTLRLVIAASVPDRSVTVEDETLGSATVEELSWSSVQSLFADGADATSAVAAARTAVARRGLAEALELPEVADLLDAHDLLWFAPGELDLLP